MLKMRTPLARGIQTELFLLIFSFTAVFVAFVLVLAIASAIAPLAVILPLGFLHLGIPCANLSSYVQ